MSLQYASALVSTPAAASLQDTVNRLERAGVRSAWARSAPTNVLLLPAGQAVGAVADVMSVELEGDKTHGLRALYPGAGS